MDNVTARVNGSKLTIEVDLTKASFTRSTDKKTGLPGPTYRIASSEGNQRVSTDGIGRHIVVGLNCYVKVEELDLLKAAMKAPKVA